MAIPSAAEPSTLQDRKAALRAHVRAARKDRARADRSARDADAQALTEVGMQFLADLGFGKDPLGCVTAYEPMRTEPPIGPFADRLRGDETTVLVPITLAHGQLRWREADPAVGSNPLVAVADADLPSWGPEALARVEVAFIPALAISTDGRRLGQGGGYYDRAIPALRVARPQTLVVAIVFAGEFGMDVPTDLHDIQVDVVMTPEGVHLITALARATVSPPPRP